jgi:hypothetical protein
MRGIVIRLSIPKEIQNIPQGTCVSLVDFGVPATRARNSRKLLVLNIKEFRKTPASCSKLAFFKFIILTFCTLPIVVLHLILLSGNSVDRVNKAVS